MPAVPKPRRKPKKKRHPLVRVSVLKRSPPKQTSGKPKRFAKKRNPEYKAWIKSLPCVLAGRKHPTGQVHDCMGTWVEPAHVKSRGAGADDLGQLVPLDAFAHASQHKMGIKSWATYWFGGLDELKRIAAETYPEQWLKQKELGWPE